MGVYVPVDWQPGSTGGTHLSTTNFNKMEDRIEAMDELFQMMGGTAASYSTAIGSTNTFMWSNGVSPAWRTASQIRTSLGLVIGTNVQAYDLQLANIAGLTAAANKGIVFTGSTSAALFTLSTFARTFLDDTTAAAVRATIAAYGSGSTATLASLVTTGNVQVGGQGWSDTATLTDAATIAVDCNNGNVFTVTLGGNRTLGAPSNLKNGATYVFIIKQPASGGPRTLAYNAVYKFPGGNDPVISTGANDVDVMSCVSDGTNLYCTVAKDFS